MCLFLAAIYCCFSCLSLSHSFRYTLHEIVVPVVVETMLIKMSVILTYEPFGNIGQRRTVKNYSNFKIILVCLRSCLATLVDGF